VRSCGNTAFKASIASCEDAFALLVVTLVPGDDLTKVIQGNARFAANQLIPHRTVERDEVAAGRLAIKPCLFLFNMELVGME
jgi:hypothetical protein